MMTEIIDTKTCKLRIGLGTNGLLNAVHHHPGYPLLMNTLTHHSTMSGSLNAPIKYKY